jgi:hypothetical protein
MDGGSDIRVLYRLALVNSLGILPIHLFSGPGNLCPKPLSRMKVSKI